MKTIGYVSYQNNPNDPDPDLDIPFLVPALEALGNNVDVINWQSTTNFLKYDLLVIRSPWDYAQNFNQFHNWLHLANSQVKVINPVAVIDENIDKRYLLKLAAAGIEIIPTQILESVAGLNDIELHDGKMVMKPVIGAGARGAFIVDDDSNLKDLCQRHFSATETPLLVQPYLKEVDHPGEIAVVCCKGEIMHSIIKRPALSDGGHGDFAANVDISTELTKFINQIMEFEIAGTQVSELVYSRVDVVPTAEGFKLMELELIEPFLFLPMNPDSTQVFATAIHNSID
jgi:glutathione synthase/RimK-type ligase-like ATP-grasp enzyme